MSFEGEVISTSMPSAEASALAFACVVEGEVEEGVERSEGVESCERAEPLGDAARFLARGFVVVVALDLGLVLEVVEFVAEDDFWPAGRPRLRVVLVVSTFMSVSVSGFVVVSVTLLDLALALGFDLPFGRGGEKDGRARFGAGAMAHSTSTLQTSAE
jgi:hypothetical protein